MNIFEIMEFPEKEEIFEILEKREHIKIEKILSKGQTTDWQIQENEEFVLLLQGKAKIEFENREITLKKGDFILIKKNEKHRVSYTSKEPTCIWFCVHF